MRSRKEEIFNELARIHDEHLWLLDFLLKDEDDVDFFEEYYMNDDISISNIYDLRINQRFKKSTTKERFIKLYNENKKEALELFFQEPLTNDAVEKFVQADKPLGEVYTVSASNPSLQLHTLLDDYDNVKNASGVSSFADLLY